MLRLSTKHNVSKFRPKAKQWDNTAILKAIASTYNKNPIEQNPLLPLSTQDVNTVPEYIGEHNTNLDYTSNQFNGERYAENLMLLTDRYVEERQLGGVSPLEGFKNTPRFASEANHAFVGHQGRWKTGDIGLGVVTRHIF